MFTLNDIVRITKGRLIQGQGLTKVGSVSIDSRHIKRGSLFVAVKGGRHDGHHFVPQACQNGAAAIVVSRPVRGKRISKGIIVVEDTVRALGRLAQAYRRRFGLPVIAITGSAGKTSTKELIAAVLRSRLTVLRNPGTENNQFGVPLTLFKICPRHQVLVLELGTNRPGDIAWLAALSEPDVAVFTNIGESHLERLLCPRKVFAEKRNLISSTSPAGTVIINRDDRYLRTIKKQDISQRLVTYGMETSATFRAGQVRRLANGRWAFKVNRRYTLTVPTGARHEVSNTLAAVACGRLFGVGFSSIARCLEGVSALPGRQDIRDFNGLVVIDDTYNANPVSFESALKTLMRFEGKGRKIVICADMLELGRQSRALHVRCGVRAARLGVDAILGYGPQTAHLIQAAQQSRRSLQALHFKNRRSLHARLARYCRPGDVCLVKGSRKMAMDRTVRFLENRFGTNKGQ